VARLILQFEDRILKECSVGLMATIGRLPDNTVVIDNPAVSGHHACVFRDGDAYIVEDLQSTNGTFVNEKRVTRRTLQNRDVLLIGKHTLVFDQMARDEPVLDDTNTPIADVDSTVFLDTRQHRALLAKLGIEDHAKKAAGVSVKAGRAAARAKVGVLKVIRGNADRSEFNLEAHTSLIGKQQASLIRLKGWFKPKVAIAITRDGHSYVATLLHGNTLINHQRRRGRYHLSDGDLLEVGGLVLEFNFKE
jgi:pSer/pThr/pTyr-binding forkhead associated (FHA) protein